MKIFLSFGCVALASIFVAACSSTSDSTGTSGEDALQAAGPIGVDSAHALSPSEAQSLQRQHGVNWSGVYIGGPCNGGFGWSRPVVQGIHDATGFQFMPIYVGQQARAICGATDLSYGRGGGDGNDAARIMGTFGWGAHAGIPVALDVEEGTFESNRGAAIEYTRGWVDAVHGAGYVAYVYSGPAALDAMVGAGVQVDGGWVASWVRNGFDPSLNPYQAPGLRSFTNHNRAWQYSGNIPGGYDVDVADLILAPGPGESNSGTCTADETGNAAKFGCACVDHRANGGFCDGTGCSAEETSNAGAFGCACVDHQANGGFCPGTGCTARETLNAGNVGCTCVDHQPSGGFCPGTGCTALETNNAGSVGCACVDHQPNGGFCPGTGCTALEITNAANFGCTCVDHQPSGGFCPGTGCTALETENAAKVGCGCVDHKPAGGFCPGTGCTAAEERDCTAQGRGCSLHKCM